MVKDETQEEKAAKVVLVDIAPHGVWVKGLAGDTAEPPTAQSLGFDTAFPAPAPTEESERGRISDIEIWKQFAREFEANVLGAGFELEKTIFVLGVEHDPLLPAPRIIGISLRIIEYLAKIGPGLLCIQTRSPLIVLALPVLKGLGRRACVALHLESRDDQKNFQLNPYLPRPSERIRTLRLLKKTGIATVAVVRPPEKEQGLATYAMLLNELHLPTVFANNGETADALRRYYLRLGGRKTAENVIEHLHLLTKQMQEAAKSVTCQAA